jgi:hypothetical protein
VGEVWEQDGNSFDEDRDWGCEGKRKDSHVCVDFVGVWVAGRKCHVCASLRPLGYEGLSLCTEPLAASNGSVHTHKLRLPVGHLLQRMRLLWEGCRGAQMYWAPASATEADGSHGGDG